MNKKKLPIVLRIVALLAFTLATWIFWSQAYPHVLSYQEQNQLFLFTCDYFINDIAQAGGLADYVSEFIVQFYYIPALGALMLAVLMLIIQWLADANSRAIIASRHGAEALTAHPASTQTAFILSFVPAALLMRSLSDENVLLSFCVAVAMALALALLPTFRKLWQNAVLQIILVPLIYWAIGPMVWLYAVLYVVRHGVRYAFVPLLCALSQYVAYNFVLMQSPLSDIIFGLKYYRIPLEVPTCMWLVPLLTAVFIALPGIINPAKVFSSRSRIIGIRSFAIGVTIATLGNILSTFASEKVKFALIEQDYLIRNERWQDVITAAEEYMPEVNFASQSVNLALAMTDQLAYRQFEFYQSGSDALLMPMIRDNTSDLPSMEAFWHLGMINESMRYAFDIQESILKGQKSGRLTKRIAEACIVNGKYEVARKQIHILKHTLFYSQWACDAEKYLGNEQLINTHYLWGRLRSMRQQNDYIYNYGEMYKMLGQLYLGNKSNKMAFEYFLAQILLDGNVPEFMQYGGLIQQSGFYTSMPETYRDAATCIQQHGNAPGSRYADYVKRMTSTKQKNSNEPEQSLH